MTHLCEDVVERDADLGPLFEDRVAADLPGQAGAFELPEQLLADIGQHQAPAVSVECRRVALHQADHRASEIVDVTEQKHHARACRLPDNNARGLREFATRIGVALADACAPDEADDGDGDGGKAEISTTVTMPKTSVHASRLRQFRAVSASRSKGVDRGLW